MEPRPLPRLFISRLAELDWLTALEFGRVDDGQPPENWRGVSDSFGFLRDGPSGPAVGFKILDFSGFDENDDEVSEIWDGPRFDVPALGLSAVTPGEIVIAARPFFGDENSINRDFFDTASGVEPQEAFVLWRACLQMGDSMAHFGLGTTLYDLGDFSLAYRHLRHYTEIAPSGGWNWCWLGRAAEAIGEVDEARRAYERAIELEADDGVETDARELLEQLLQAR